MDVKKVNAADSTHIDRGGGSGESQRDVRQRR